MVVPPKCLLVQSISGTVELPRDSTDREIALEGRAVRLWIYKKAAGMFFPVRMIMTPTMFVRSSLGVSPGVKHPFEEGFPGAVACFAST
jgi:hypothetical protein